MAGRGRRRTASAPAQARSIRAAASADKQQWVAQRARAGVFQGIAKGARWQDYADRLLDDRRRSDKKDAN